MKTTAKWPHCGRFNAFFPLRRGFELARTAVVSLDTQTHTVLPVVTFLPHRPWFDLARHRAAKFAAYVVNETITFSAGIVMTQPKMPVRQLARSPEQALESAKSFEKTGKKKNAVTLWSQSIVWADWQALMGARRAALEALMARAGTHGAEFSTGLTYSLLQLSDRAESKRPEDAIWRSQLHYRLARFFRDRVKGDDNARERREKLLADAIGEIGGALGIYKGAYRLPLSVLLYRQRD